MKIDGALSMSVTRSGAEAAEFERMGLAGAWSFEANHDPFVPLTLASQTTERIQLGTAIAVAYARTPMTAAVTAWDLQRLSGGRFILGLGTQIKPHIEKRYGMPWSNPARRMGEYVHALRAIWHSWSTGDRLDFRGEFYTHTLMTPAFSPGPNEVPPPPIYVAGVGPRMVRVIGEVADGFFVHPFHSVDFLRSDTLPLLEEGAVAAGRDSSEIDIACITIVAVGTNDEELDDARSKAKAQLAFYGSTPAYAGVLDHHGYEGLQPELNMMSKQGQWREMTEQIDDELLGLLTVSGSPAEVGRKMAERNTFANRSTMMFYGPTPSPETIAEIVDSIRAASSP
ncbi:MAG: TIGR03617 family F420-dependent LLM class oxidoreductase [Actinomycetia bacterium]|nr:TIGR03617 family F420-dependent LLM class oxidoreductase [Actinomycetes bacterium]MCP4225790.1 TIGR03617 family F420-dependent LLM class oxidoreductase [Actinomycetes bacterium]MCP5034898.1 TIGR03617 family F420-dependent LLM class oxidoreductase [Actinomycetes bacterium]